MICFTYVCVCVFFKDIVVLGERHFFQANSDAERSTWVEKLRDASKITVVIFT